MTSTTPSKIRVDCIDQRHLLAERSLRSREFARAYGWETVVDQWDALLRGVANRRQRIGRVTPTKSQSDAEGLSTLRVFVPEGVSVKVDFAERNYGRLESSLLADRSGRLSDVKIPTVPRASMTESVKVIRAFGYVGVGGAEKLFGRLQTIFPVLSGWRVESQSTMRQSADDLETLRCSRFEDARLHLAQSVLLLNFDGIFETGLLWDAAFFGVPCVGDASEVQRRLWPHLCATSGDEAVCVARRVLTDAAFAESAVKAARDLIPPEERRDEQEVAAWLRRLSAARMSEAPSVTEA